MAINPDLPEDEEEPVTKEMFDASYKRVDVVKGPASGMRFVVLKAGQEQDYDAVIKAKYTAEEQRSMLAKGQAFKGPKGEPSYPIGDKADLSSAIHAVGRGNESHNAIRAYIIRRAKALGASSEIPDDWAADGSLKEASVKKSAKAAEAVKKADDLDVTEVLAEPESEDEGAGDVTEPGSPAWEAVDAATAMKWTAILSRAKNALQVMSDREAMEVATGADDDDAADNAFDLDDACCAIDYAIGVLAPFAVGEQAEADQGSEDAESVAKTMRAAESIESDLDVIESLTPVKKAGRVLSAANETAIRTAVASLSAVLESLPAPAPDAEPVAKAKEADMTESQPVAKAKGDPMVACYNESGQLIGVVDPDDLQAIAAGTPVDKAADATDADAPADADATDAEDAAPAPAEAAEAPGPAAPGADDADAADAAAPAPAPAPEEEPVAKSAEIIGDLVRKAVAEALEEAEEGHRAVVKQLEERVETLERQPAPGGPLLHGLASGGGQMPLRGQDGTEGNIPAELMAVRKQYEAETDPAKKADLGKRFAFELLKTGYSMQGPSLKS